MFGYKWLGKSWMWIDFNTIDGSIMDELIISCCTSHWFVKDLKWSSHYKDKGGIIVIIKQWSGTDPNCCWLSTKLGS